MSDNANPLLTASTLPYALPPYADIRPEHYLPAFERAFADHTRRDLGDHPGSLDADVREHDGAARGER